MSGLNHSILRGGIRQEPDRVLVSKLGHIGDVLVVTPFFKALKDIFPKVHTTALVNRGTEDMVLGCPYVDRVLVVERGRKSFWEKCRDSLKLISSLRQDPFDMSFELSAGDRGTYMCRVAGARLRVGFNSGENHVRDRLLHVLIPRYKANCHEVENFLRQLSIFQRPFNAPALAWKPSATAEQLAGNILNANGLDNYVLAHPTSRWMFKAWTPQKNAQVLNHLSAQGRQIVLTSGPDARELEYINYLLAGLAPNARVLNLAGKLSLPVLGALIAKAKLFFGVDSAPMHMAAAVQTPTVVLFGPSGEHMWGPWQVEHQVITGDCEKRPCGRDGCNGSKICNTLVELPVSKVCAVIDKFLSEPA